MSELERAALSPGSMLSPKSLAKRWDCRPGHVYKLIKTGKLASVKFGPHMVRIPAADITRYEDDLCRCNGDLESIEEATPQSSEAEMAAAASSSMRLRRAQRSVLSGT